MKVAICSSNGSHVDLHFGKTSNFYIYELSKKEKFFIDKRSVGKYSPVKKFLREEGESHPFDQKKFDAVYNVIGDCKKVYTVSIGEVPKKKLHEKGIEVQLCNCPVDLIPICGGNCK